TSSSNPVRLSEPGDEDMKRFLWSCVGVAILALVAVLTISLWPTATRRIAAAIGGSDSPALVERGRYLAQAGDCVACHTAPGGKPFAGGLPLASPIGAMYSTNITPDRTTGIGNYTLDDFDRAVRHGIRADGDSLYPAMPYPSYARMNDDDLRALYSFFRHGVAPAPAQPHPHATHRPLSTRWPMALRRNAF